MASKGSLGFLTNVQKMSRGIWPWTTGPRARLPLHYKQRYVQKYMKEPTPVHFKPNPNKWEVDEFGERKRVQNVPITVVYPWECNEGLWGGEGVIKGLFQKDNNPKKPRYAKYIVPKLKKRVFYSEILDRYMAITCTLRTLDLIDEALGFDNYILKTHEVDLRSELGMKIKRDMILALAKGELYPNDAAKKAEILEKYKEFILPVDEAEWFGLSISDAESKLLMAEEEARVAAARPLKEEYFRDLIQKLQDGTADEDASKSGFLSRFNPFKGEDEKKEASS